MEFGRPEEEEAEEEKRREEKEEKGEEESERRDLHTERSLTRTHNGGLCWEQSRSVRTSAGK